jgi:glycerophosphoryl diester phosphodiesterase
MALRIGHRGAAGTHPENTMVSFRRAVELGCDGVEFDVHKTRDGHLVVIHDAFVNRTTNGQGLIREMTLDQLKALDAGCFKGDQFKGERIPTLHELIEGTPSSLKLFCELKAGSIHYPGIEEDLLKAIDAAGARDRFQISSFDHVALKRIHEMDPSMPLGMLYSENMVDAVGLAQSLGCNALHPTWEWTTPDLVARAHAAGMQVNVWTVNMPMAVQMMKAIGVDGIMSDFPDRV